MQVINDNQNISVITIGVRCKVCGNRFIIDVPDSGEIPDHITNCYRCLAEQSRNQNQKKYKQGVCDVS